MEIVFATNNTHKLKEIRSLLPASIKVLSLKDIGCTEELPETGNTLEANSLQKARYIFDKYGYACFADDTGLEVDALNGRPGVFSARFAGPECRAEDNIRKLLTELKGESNRTARFRTVIALLLNGNPIYFEGTINGRITASPSGKEGFGYDPVFIPEGMDRTFSEMSAAEKNEISHRAKAVNRLLTYFNERESGS